MADRMGKLLEILARKGYRSVPQLAEHLEVSEMTVRRYLSKLELQSLVKRTHGGAFAGQDMIEVDYRVRETVMRAEKEAIGRLAASLIQPGESVFIDSGSTAAFLAGAIDDTKRITVITNSTVVLQTLENKENVETICIGGKVHKPSHSLVGVLAEDAVKQFRFTKAFIGTNGVDLAYGFSQVNVEEVPVKKTVISNSQEVIVLADNSKFSRSVLMVFMRLEQAGTVISDWGLPAEHRQTLEEKGIHLIVALPPSSRAVTRNDL